MSERDDLRHLVDRVLGDRCGPEQRRVVEHGGWPSELWSALRDLGVTGLGSPEALGGSGGGLAEAADLLVLAGRHAVPVPLVEHTFLGCWLLTSSGLPVGDGILTCAPPGSPVDARRAGDGWSLSGSARRVPFARHADEVVVLASCDNAPVLAAVPIRAARVETGRNLAGEPRDTVVLDDVRVGPERAAVAAPGIDPAGLELRAALGCALQMTGALARVAEMTVDYAGVREQFGRPIGSFQAVKQHLVRLSNEATASAAAVQGAVVAYASVSDASFEVAAARSVVNGAADLAVALAHQVHGAIGMTEEYELQQYSRRLMSWRQQYGSARAWSERVGAQVLAGGADALWPLVSGTTHGRDGLELLRQTDTAGG